MKNKKYGIIICLCLIFTSCSDLLDKTTYGSITSEIYYKTDEQIGEVLTGAYLQLRVTWNEFALDQYLIGDCSTDDALKGGGSEQEMYEMVEISYFTVHPTNTEVARRWRLLYGLINRANDVIYYGADARGDNELIRRYINEAKLLRAFGYYFLVTSFGEVPLITEPTTPEVIFAVTRATTDEVYSLIIDDLTDALDLPAKSQYADAERYRVTNGMAKAMLGKTYMFIHEYGNAEKVLREIVESGEYSLFPEYGYNWRPEYENGSESIFEIPNKMYDRNVGTGTNVPHFFTSRRVSGYQGYGYHCPTQDLLDAYDPDDPRITYVFTRTGDRYTGDTQEQDNGMSPTGFHDYKMTVPAVDKVGYDVWLIEYNIRFIRYADILLLYAEALNENGKPAEALVFLNQIRARARQTNPVDPRKDIQVYIPPTTENTLPDITTTQKEALRELIWQERRLELAMEGWRREDLIRQGRFGEVMKNYARKYDSLKGEYFNEVRDNLLPIPQNEIDRTNGSITQNPNY